MFEGQEWEHIFVLEWQSWQQLNVLSWQSREHIYIVDMLEWQSWEPFTEFQGELGERNKEESSSPCSSVNVEHNSPCSSVNVEQNSPCLSVSVEQNSPCSSDTVESDTTSARDRVESTSSCSSDRVDSVSDEPGSSDVTAEHSETYISSDDSIQRGKLGPGTNSESAESALCVPTEVDSSDPGRKKMPSPICSQSLEYEKPEFEDDSVHIETWYLDDEHVRHLESTTSCSPVPDRTGDAVQQSAVNEHINSSVASVMDSFSEFFAPALDLPASLDIPASLDLHVDLDHHVDLETSCNETWYETSDDHPNNDASCTVDVAKVGGNQHAAAEVRDAEAGDAHGADDAISDLLNETSFFDALPLDAELEAPGSATVEPYNRDLVPSLKSEASPLPADSSLATSCRQADWNKHFRCKSWIDHQRWTWFRTFQSIGRNSSPEGSTGSVKWGHPSPFSTRSETAP